jgi:hypothetical protein
MRAHSSGRVTSFVTERDGVRWRKILHLTGCKILHLTRYDVSDAVRTILALDISMSTRGIEGGFCSSIRHLSEIHSFGPDKCT